MVNMHLNLSRDDFGRLLLVDLRAVEEPVIPVRAFPLAAPTEGVSLVGTDGRERRWIPNLAELDETSRNLIQTDLDARELVPEILRIVSVSTFATPSIWTVETDRGDTSFILKGEEDIRRLGRTGLLIAGSQGVQYSVPDMTALDRNSRKLLERFL